MGFQQKKIDIVLLEAIKHTVSMSLYLLSITFNTRRASPNCQDAMTRKDMNVKIWKKKWFIISILLIVLVPSIFLVGLRINFEQREDEVLRYFSQEAGMPDTFASLKNLTTEESIILCWWDYGRAVEQWSNRTVVEAYPSRDIWYSTGASRDFIHNLEMQIFGKWGDFFGKFMTSLECSR